MEGLHRWCEEYQQECKDCLINSLCRGHMNIQEPDQATEVYEQALKKSTKDPASASKIGNALPKTHNYSKAFYKYSIRLIKH